MRVDHKDAVLLAKIIFRSFRCSHRRVSRSARDLPGEHPETLHGAKLTVSPVSPFPTIRETPTLVILEPQLSSRTEIPVVQPTVSLPTRVVDRKNQRHLKLVRGLEWILAPGYADEEGGRTIMEITKAIGKDDDMGELRA